MDSLTRPSCSAMLSNKRLLHCLNRLGSKPQIILLHSTEKPFEGHFAFVDAVHVIPLCKMVKLMYTDSTHELFGDNVSPNLVFLLTLVDLGLDLHVKFPA